MTSRSIHSSWLILWLQFIYRCISSGLKKIVNRIGLSNGFGTEL
jgi:hypothetical protein